MVITTESKEVEKMQSKIQSGSHQTGDHIDPTGLKVLERSPLFSGIAPADMSSILRCLGAKSLRFRKNEIIQMAGDQPKNIGIVLSGQLQIFKDDSFGNRTLLTSILPAEIYGESICCAGLTESPVSVMAMDNSMILSLAFPDILKTCSNACDFHGKLIENMMFVLARKNIFLQNRMDILTEKSLRTKIMIYLESFVPTQGGDITIPLNREQMAAYLCVDRSALSHELIKMKDDGLIRYQRNRFHLTHRFSDALAASAPTG